MDEVDNKYAEKERPNIIVCDLGMLDWLGLADGIVLVDYRYIREVQEKAEIKRLSR